MKTRILSPILTLLALSSLANAATAIYTTEASFLAAITGLPSTYSFDELAPVVVGPIAYTGAGFSLSATTPVAFFNYAQPGGDVWISSSRNGDPITFTMSGGNSYAFGGYFFSTNSAGDANGASVTVAANDGTVAATGPSTPSSFIGFVSDAPISSVVVSVSGEMGVNFPTANNVTLGAIPEPSSLGLVAVAALAGVMTRRRNTTAA